jgi:glucose-1-phosphate thymidylyltransferase
MAYLVMAPLRRDNDEGTGSGWRLGYPAAPLQLFDAQAAHSGREQAGPAALPGEHPRGRRDGGRHDRRPRAAEIRAAVDAVADLGLRITYIPQDRPRGLAHCVQIAGDFLGEEDFVMYLGDNVLAGGIADLADEFRAGRPDAQLVVTKVADPAEYGIAELDPDGAVVRVVEKPREPRSDLAVIGVYFFTAAIHEATASISPSGRGEYEITDAIQWLVERGRRVQARVFSGYWKDTGRIEDVLDCNRVLLEGTRRRVDGDIDAASDLIGEVVVEAGARVVASTVIGPAILGAGTVVEGSHVGPHTSVGRGCLLTGSSIENSIVLDDVRIQQVRGIRGSLIGRAARVHSGAGHDWHLLVIGDHTTVRFVA